jgi:ribosomal RNA-processing protein 1
MHDSKNAVSVQNFTAELAGLLEIIASKDAELSKSGNRGHPWLETWTTAFWETICREWSSIDQWRMNKVLLLVRFFLRDLFNLVLMSTCNDASTGGPASEDMTSGQIRVLESWPLSPRERKVPDGLRLHVLDIWADELSGQISAVRKELRDAHESDRETIEIASLNTAKTFMGPLEKVSREALGKGVKIRAKEALKLFEEQFPS